MSKRFAVYLALTAAMFVPAQASNLQDEQTVRTAYAKLAYGVQSRTVYMEARTNPDITSVELAKLLQASELRFDITEMSSGAVSEIATRPYSDFVAPTDMQDVLFITFNTRSAVRRASASPPTLQSRSGEPDRNRKRIGTLQSNRLS
jgi:hypothetical protein